MCHLYAQSHDSSYQTLFIMQKKIIKKKTVFLTATAEFLTKFNIFFKVIIRIFVPSFGLFPDIAYVRHRIFVKLKKKKKY